MTLGNGDDSAGDGLDTMIERTRSLFFTTARLFWLAYGAFLWIFWLVSVPPFLQRAAAGTLPTTAIEGLSAAQAAAASAMSWGTSAAVWSWISTVVSGFSFLVFSLVAFLIWRRVRTGFGLLTAYVLLLGGSAFMGVAVYSAEISETATAAWLLGALIWPLFFIWLYLFPNGRAIPRHISFVLGPLLAVFGSIFLLSTYAIFLDDSSPIHDAVARLLPISEALVLPMLLLVIVAQVYRYVRVSAEFERLQTRWFVFGLLIAFAPSFTLSLWGDYPTELDTLSFTALPVGIGISILRYRLYDIDVIIRKTLMYAVLSGLLALVYFGAVILLQNLFDSVSGQQSPLVIVLSTLIIAALFAPLRQRVQAGIDRRFFRKKYDAQQILAQFAQTARDEVEMEALTAELLHVVQETMWPEQISVWVKPVIRDS